MWLTGLPLAMPPPPATFTTIVQGFSQVSPHHPSMGLQSKLFLQLCSSDQSRLCRYLTQLRPTHHTSHPLVPKHHLLLCPSAQRLDPSVTPVTRALPITTHEVASRGHQACALPTPRVSYSPQLGGLLRLHLTPQPWVDHTMSTLRLTPILLFPSRAVHGMMRFKLQLMQHQQRTATTKHCTSLPLTGRVG